MTENALSCEDCATSAYTSCCGPAGHALEAAIRAIAVPPRELADLLGVDVEDLDFCATSAMLSFLGRLRFDRLESVVKLAGYSVIDAVAVLASRTDRNVAVPEPSAASSVTAIILQHAPHGCRVDEIADELGWSLPTVCHALDELRAHPPPGARLHTTPQQRLVLRPDLMCLRHTAIDDGGELLDHIDSTTGDDTPDAQTPLPLRLDLEQAKALWRICRGQPIEDIPDTVLADLAEAGVISTETTPPRPSAAVSYSLQWWPKTAADGAPTP
ncbi:hypothetical protein AB0H34_03060 [Saccharopolyspora shandongensis]|uniref:hypothetical protein n=1 Tax=Saccharopolyspora shandongensis TaxID=418495 RepID=UPI0033D6B5D4